VKVIFLITLKFQLQILSPNLWYKPNYPFIIEIMVQVVMMFKATFNNISVILWWSVLLVEETRENHLPVSSLSH